MVGGGARESVSHIKMVQVNIAEERERAHTPLDI